MATLKEITLIRDARAGDASAQLTLGRQYLFGGKGLPRNVATALYWLDRAAQQNAPDAWLLIGSHVPFEVAVRAAQPLQLCHWYERAFDAGVVQAGLAFAKLVLQQTAGSVDPALRSKAFNALEAAAHANIPEAQLFLAQQLAATTQSPAPPNPAAVSMNALEWEMRAAENGVLEAQRRLAARAWATGDHTMFLRWALPLARSIADGSRDCDSANSLREADVLLLSCCAKALSSSIDSDAHDVERFWELAAQSGDREAQFSLGLWYARMNETGDRISHLHCRYPQAIHWLTRAAEQGVIAAWYALGKLYLRPAGFPDRSWTQAQRFLARAAEAGHCGAQLELGKHAWRTRRDSDASEELAVYWLQKAAAQGNDNAHTLLKSIAAFGAPAPWARTAQSQFTDEMVRNYPFLTARIELAAMFGLNCPEALLLDIGAADREHYLLIDIHAHYGRSKRRFILIETDEQRRTLIRVRRLFANIDPGPLGPEGSYKQRFYLFNKLFSLSEEESKAMFRSVVKPLLGFGPNAAVAAKRNEKSRGVSLKARTAGI